jgi:hypothetical protein
VQHSYWCSHRVRLSRDSQDMRNQIVFLFLFLFFKEIDENQIVKAGT